jgi:predicted RND superfamily exporter protein
MDLIKNVHDYIDHFEFTGKVLSLASVIRVAEGLNSDKEFDNLELSVIYKKLPKELKSQILDPYLSIDKNQARITVRMIDTNKNLKRNEFLNEINDKFQKEYNTQNFSIITTGILVLYNNMLQSLFDSQISSLGTVMLGIFIMLMFLFKSWKLAMNWNASKYNCLHGNTWHNGICQYTSRFNDHNNSRYNCRYCS